MREGCLTGAGNAVDAVDLEASNLEASGLFEQLLAKSPAQRVHELERLICDTLATALRIETSQIQSNESLVSLGLDSLIGMSLRSKLEKALRTELPEFGILGLRGTEPPTVQVLARVAAESIKDPAKPNTCEADKLSHGRQDSKRRRRSGVVALGGAHRPKAPIFCLHPVGGDLRCYDRFSRHLTTRPVFGLRSRGLDAYSEPHRCMDAMISDYASEIERASGQGPICLLGWSTGGIFARELAIRLHKQDREIEAVVMVDTPMPDVFEQVDLADNLKFLSDLVTFTNYFAGNSMQIDPAFLSNLNDEQAVQRVLELGMANGVLPSHATTQFLERLIDVCKKHVEILQHYSPSQTSLESILIRPHDPSVLCRAAGRSLPSDLGWGSFGKTDLHQVPGHHFTMMTSTNAADLALKVEQLIG